MKKFLLISLSLCMTLLLVPTNPISANNENSSNVCSSCNIQSDELENVTYTDEVYDENGELISFTAIVPLAPGEIPEAETRGIIGAIVTIVAGLYKSCKVAFYTTGGFNPCTYLAGVLGRKIINGIVQWQQNDAGKWDVQRTSHWGKIPNCEPMHSGGCTGWYYTYSYKKVS